VLYLCRLIIGGDAFRFVTELRLPNLQSGRLLTLSQ
jgi:hypothetical protein